MISVNYRDFSDRIYQAAQEHETKTGERVLLDVMIELTRLCTIKCVHCYIGDARWVRDPEEMKTQDIYRLLDHLAKQGTLWVCFTGGEPLLRKDFREIWLYAKGKGFLLTLFSNGTLFTKEMMDFLAENPPFGIEVSLYGATKETYERVSLVKGSFDRAMSGIAELRARKHLRWILKSVGIRENHEEIHLMESLAKEWGVEFKFDPLINPSVGSGKTGGKAPCSTRLDPEEVFNLEMSSESRKNENNKIAQELKTENSCLKRTPGSQRDSKLFGCSAGANNSYITAKGEMQMCLLTPKHGGRILEDQKFSERAFGFVWDAFAESRKLKLDPKSPCSGCDLAGICSNCAGFSFLETQDEHGAVEYLCKVTHEKARLLGIPHQCKDTHFIHHQKAKGEHQIGKQESRKEKVCGSGDSQNSAGC